MPSITIPIKIACMIISILDVKSLNQHENKPANNAWCTWILNETFSSIIIDHNIHHVVPNKINGRNCLQHLFLRYASRPCKNTIIKSTIATEETPILPSTDKRFQKPRVSVKCFKLFLKKPYGEI